MSREIKQNPLKSQRMSIPRDIWRFMAGSLALLVRPPQVIDDKGQN